MDWKDALSIHTQALFYRKQLKRHNVQKKNNSYYLNVSATANELQGKGIKRG